MLINFQVTPVFLANMNAYKNPKFRIIANQGGTSSSKTYSILQLIIAIAYNQTLDIEVCAITVPHYKNGALKDFIDILQTAGLYNEQNHNKTDQTFKLGNSRVTFNSYENSGKARGPRRDVLFINEVNLFDKDTYTQLVLRTRHKIFIDYNPADEFHWLYEDVLTRQDCKLIQSTYLDSYDFLPDFVIKDIERLKDEDQNLWNVYGLGNRGVGRAKIYNNYQFIDAMPYTKAEDRCYGLDFGFNNPTALVEVLFFDQNLYWDEKIYESGLSTPDLLEKMEALNIPKNIPIYCDSASPEKIQELNNAGFWALKANKAVNAGIDFIKGTSKGSNKHSKLYITNSSTNIKKEIKQYKYKEDGAGNITEEPVKFMDHALDAGRYASYTHHLNNISNIPSYV